MGTDFRKKKAEREDVSNLVLAQRLSRMEWSGMEVGRQVWISQVKEGGDTQGLGGWCACEVRTGGRSRSIFRTTKGHSGGQHQQVPPPCGGERSPEALPAHLEGGDCSFLVSCSLKMLLGFLQPLETVPFLVHPHTDKKSRNEHGMPWYPLAL